MSEWWTYTLSDIQSFSVHSYYRLFELYNRAIWPAQVLALALAIAILVLLRRSEARRARLITAILALCWLWIAIAFHAHRYATLTWSARYFAWGFGVEATLLLWTALRGRLIFERRLAGLVIFLAAMVLPPLIGPFLGRSWRQVELFGLAPDPTAVATLGVLLLSAGRVRWELIAVPLLWCAVSGATLLSMHAPDAAIPIAGAVLGLTVAVSRALTRRRQL